MCIYKTCLNPGRGLVSGELFPIRNAEMAWLKEHAWMWTETQKELSRSTTCPQVLWLTGDAMFYFIHQLVFFVFVFVFGLLIACSIHVLCAVVFMCKWLPEYNIYIISNNVGFALTIRRRNPSLLNKWIIGGRGSQGLLNQSGPENYCRLGA